MSQLPGEIVSGARVYSMSEPELGIGIVTRIEDGVAVLQFPTAKMARRYALKSAPIRRALLAVGQRAKLKNGADGLIKELRFEKGLAQYLIDAEWIWEFDLSTEQSDLGALEQFLSGQWTHPEAFDLRKEAWRLKAGSSNPLTRGLIGSRVDLLPHQLFIASSVVSRLNPRVLLADEVGLGKTIEAGLILSSLHRLGRATRILIVVPEALKTQWLAELYRRFQLLFSILDEPRCLEEEKSNSTLSPFEGNSLVICTLEHFMNHEQRLKQAVSAEWDLLIIDEAHHLLWNPSDPSPAWLVAKHLTEATKSLLLLTATPRQHGLDTQFGLLNLVDPERFSNFDKFSNDSAHLDVLSQFARNLIEEAHKTRVQDLKKIFPEDPELSSEISTYETTRNPQPLLMSLIDRHGPGRVLFRNRRAKLKGFPERALFAEPIEGHAKYGDPTGDFTRAHPKLKWLETFLNANKNEKILIITSTAAQVKQIDQYLLERVPVKKALFHDEMEMLERDRQAAWFSEPKGSQILIASEIGGEGRNFQFCKKIVLLNLPPQPDLVEQRIGRLDRIGQKNTIEIIVPYIINGIEHLYFELFNQGLQLFTQASAGLGALTEPFQTEIDGLKTRLLESTEPVDIPNTIAPLLLRLEKTVRLYREEQERNFDYLVDINSFNEAKGLELKDRIETLDKDYSLEDYMSRVFEFFGIEEEDLSQNIKKITANSLMFVESFPELQDEKSFTYSRATALMREEIDFLTQDHPMVSGVFSLLLDKELGRSSLGRAQIDGFSQGAVFELTFVLNPPNIQGLTLEHFLLPTVFHAAFDHRGVALGTDLVENIVVQKLSEQEENSIRNSLGRFRQILPAIHQAAQKRFETLAQEVKDLASQRARDFFKKEHDRMDYLSRINQSVSAAERTHLERHTADTLKALGEATLSLDGVRMILIEKGGPT